MATLETNSDGTEILGDSFGYVINFIEGCASPRQGAGDLVHKNRPGKATVRLKTSPLQRDIE
jgi:hypothetical protein